LHKGPQKAGGLGNNGIIIKRTSSIVCIPFVACEAERYVYEVFVGLKRTKFWGADENDDRLIRQIVAGKKTATACPSEVYHLPDGEFEDGGFEAGDLVEVYDLKNTLRCIIRMSQFQKSRV
jgi:uncharacterized protein YhfF